MGEGVIPALQKAQQAGVKIVFVDNTLPGFTPDAVSATDNVKGGQEAGAYIKSQLKSGDTIGLMEAVKGVPALDARIDGVKKALEGTGVKVVMGGQQTTCDPKIGAAVTQDLLTKYPNLTAVYSACDSPAVGASTVAKQKNHPLKIYGYDGDPEMSKLILSGDTTATMAQSPFKMTNLGIAAAVNALAGQAVREGHRHRRHVGDQGQRRPVQGRLAVEPRVGRAGSALRHASAGRSASAWPPPARRTYERCRQPYWWPGPAGEQRAPRATGARAGGSAGRRTPSWHLRH